MKIMLILTVSLLYASYVHGEVTVANNSTASVSKLDNVSCKGEALQTQDVDEICTRYRTCCDNICKARSSRLHCGAVCPLNQFDMAIFNSTRTSFGCYY